MVSTAARAPVSLDQVWSWLADVADPEIPVISIVDLGIVRGVEWGEESLTVTITPTYSGCPATEVIAESIRAALAGRGVSRVSLKQQLSPPWTTDWLSDTGREKLRTYGIAPPQCAAAAEHVVDISRILARGTRPFVPCPQCGSTHTSLVSGSGSTPCKALYRCNACAEPFDYFKPH
jgi:ring-1,2-phenylacetyl-CoA epoxidase subunit PaaD